MRTWFGIVVIYPSWRVLSLLLPPECSNGFILVVATFVSLAPMCIRLPYELGTCPSEAKKLFWYLYAAGTMFVGFLFLLIWPCLVYEAISLWFQATAGTIAARDTNIIVGCALLLIAGLASLASFVNSQLLFTTRITIKSSKIRAPVRIVHVSDLHIGSRSSSWLNTVVSKINSLHPDYVAVTGDVVDTLAVTSEDLAAFNDIHVPLLISLGNHDLGDFGHSLLKPVSNAIVLRDSHMAFPKHNLQFIGIDDRNWSVNMRRVLDSMATELDSSKFTVLLYHRPHTSAWKRVVSLGLELFLAGHTHCGQIFPLFLLVRVIFPFTAGLFRMGKSTMFVSPGTGTAGPMMRLGSVNTVAVIDIEHEKAD